MTDAQYQVPLDRTANQPVTEGIHLFSIANIVEGDSSAGNPMWTITLACLTPGEEGKQVRMFLVLNEAARWKFELFLDAVQAPVSGMATAPQFIGRKLRGQITHGMYEGRLQANVGEMWPVSNVPTATEKALQDNPVARKITAVPQTVKAVGKPVATKAVVRKAAGATAVAKEAEGNIPF